jgi:DNA-binding GntR family transcriptional regulator
MPPEGDLAREYDVSAGTIRKALDLLEFQRVLIRKQGRGTSVCGQLEYDTFSETATKALASIGATVAGSKIRLTTGATLDATGLTSGILDAAAWLERRAPVKSSRRDAA